MIGRRIFLTLATLLLTAGAVKAFDLPKEAVYPRIFSPNGDGINDIVYFDLVDPSLDTVVGKIYDQSGAPVADIRADAVDPFPAVDVKRLVWDGKDRNGNTARAGLYIYEIRGSEKSVTGTVVVAK